MSSAEKPNFYIPQKCVRVEVSPGSQFSPLVSEGPFKTAEWVVAIGELDQGESDQSPEPRVRLSRHHGRSVINPKINHQVVWADELGTIFGAVDWKGARMQTVPVIENDSTSPYGFRVVGLKDDVGLERMKIASRIMRQSGLSTEAPARIVKLGQVYRNDKLVSIDEWRHRCREEYVGVFVNGQLSTTEDAARRELVKKVQEYLESTDFYIVERYLQVAERLQDIGSIKNEEEFQRIIPPLFRWLNVVARKRGLPSAVRRVDPSSLDSLRKYFMFSLPIAMGLYLAVLHSREIVHRYPSSHNWSAVGTLYDLDSVRGVPFGDKPPTARNYQRDLVMTTGALQALWSGGYLTKLLFPDIPQKSGGIIGSANSRYALVPAYQRERERLGLKPLPLPSLDRLFKREFGKVEARKA